MISSLFQRKINTEPSFPGENLQHWWSVLQWGRVQSQQPLPHMPPRFVQTHMVHSREYVNKNVSVSNLLCLTAHSHSHKQNGKSISCPEVSNMSLHQWSWRRTAITWFCGSVVAQGCFGNLSATLCRLKSLKLLQPPRHWYEDSLPHCYPFWTTLLLQLKVGHTVLCSLHTE